MKEFMLLIRDDGDHKASLSPEEHKAFVRACEVYIGRLKERGKLIAAQPLIREGVIVSGSSKGWKERPFVASGEIQVGYYHILADDMDDAVTIAKGNPEFEFGNTASIEVRPLKAKERATGFVYPSKT